MKRKIRTRVLLARGFVPRDQTATPVAVIRIPVIGRENRATAVRSIERCGRSRRPRATTTRGQTCFGVSDSSHRDTKVVATVRASVRGEGQLLACLRYASHRGRCVGVHAFAEENVRTRDLDVNLTKSLPERGVETFWVSTHCGETRRFVTASVVRCCPQPCVNRTKKNGLRCGLVSRRRDALCDCEMILLSGFLRNEISAPLSLFERRLRAFGGLLTTREKAFLDQIWSRRLSAENTSGNRRFRVDSPLLQRGGGRVASLWFGAQLPSKTVL